MTRIVCQVIPDKPEQLTFTWSAEGGFFRPYSLNGMDLQAFRDAATQARKCLADLVKDWLTQRDDDIRKDSLALAQAGYRLYRSILFPDAEQADEARNVRTWLEELRKAGAPVESLEFVLDTECFVPWNVVYDQRPDPQAFLSGDALERWQAFWGIRYNLACCRRANPLRRLPVWEPPNVFLVVDPSIRNGLPDVVGQRRRLAEFARTHGLPWVESRAQLVAALKPDRPYLIYWLSHATPDALVLGQEEITPQELKDILRGDGEDRRNVLGVVFLNACQTAEPARKGSFLEAVFNAGLSGLIATEEYTVNTFANPFGLDFLEAFLDSGEPLGSLLHRLRRGGVPLGLLYAAYCPPDICVRRLTAPPSAAPAIVAPVAPAAPLGGALLGGPPAADRPSSLPLPEHPYRSLAYFKREHRALFTGRDDDVHRFAELLDEHGTRLLILHGQSGVGKSSFLRAGVLPYLEEECIGYRALRNRDPKEDADQPSDRPVLFIRATNDLIGQLARGLCSFCAAPYRYRTPDGRDVEVDLPGALARLVEAARPQGAAPASGLPCTEAVRAALLADPSLPGRLLAELGAQLPYGLLAVVDQCEEVFTLARSPEDQANRHAALQVLRQAVLTPGDFKVILTVRTEFYGRVTNALRRGLHDLRAVRDYLLTGLSEGDLVQAMLRPTSRQPVPYAQEIPHDRYGFEYAPGVAEAVVRGVLAVSPEGRDGALPLLQVVCTQLSEVARGRPDRVVTDADLQQIGGVEGGMRRHAEALLARLLERLAAADQGAGGSGHAGGPSGGFLGGVFRRLLPRPSEEQAFKRFFRRLYLRQSDGSLTTALTSADDLERRWHGRAPFRQMLDLAHGEEFRLVRVSALALSGQAEREYVSLGHDALAPVAAAWDEEVSRRARFRKATVLGAAVAGAALLVIAGLSLLNMHFATTTSLGQLTERTFESNSLVAQAVANQIGWKVRRGWQLMEREARDPDLIKGLKRFQGKRPGRGDLGPLAAWVRAAQKRHAAEFPAEAWVLTNNAGYELANSFRDDTVTGNFSGRDYFHGKGGDSPKPRADTGPICQPHLAVALLPVKREEPRIPLSVPVWADPSRPCADNLGVLIVNLRPDQLVNYPEELPQKARVVLFIDADGNVLHQAQLGQIAGGLSALPRMPDLHVVEQPRGSPAGGDGQPSAIQWVTWKWEGVSKSQPSGAQTDDDWLGALAPVIVRAADEEPMNTITGWKVVVGESRDTVAGPLHSMRDRFLWNGIFATVVVVSLIGAVVTLLAFRVFPRKPLGQEDLF